MTSWILPWPNDKLAWPNDKLDFTLPKWQVGFYLDQMTSPIGQMTSWILPWPNDNLDFTLAMTSPECQITKSCHQDFGSNKNMSSGFWLFKLGATGNVNSSSGFWTFLIKYVKFCLKSPKYDKHERATTAAAAAEESPGRLQPPFPSHPGIQYPVRAYPSLR